MIFFVKDTNLNWFLLKSAGFALFLERILWNFYQILYLFFVLVGLENDMKGAFQVKTFPFGETVNFRVNVKIHVLKNALKLGEIIS